MAIQRLMVRANAPRAFALAASTSRLQVRHSSAGPANVTDASFWRSLVPKPMRRENRSAWNPRSGKWNPATFFIVMFLFIGSMSIQMIALRNSFDRYRRQSTLRIARLREVVEKIQRGEEVDVEKVLGTGDAKKEADWEEMLQEIEREEVARKAQKKEKAKRQQSQIDSTPAIPTESPLADNDAPSKKTTASFGNFF